MMKIFGCAVMILLVGALVALAGETAGKIQSVGNYMSRAILAVMATLLVTGPALAFQCPKLISKIHQEADGRLDDAGYNARTKADEADALHKAGKHAEAEKAAKEGLARIGVN